MSGAATARSPRAQCKTRASAAGPDPREDAAITAELDDIAEAALSLVDPARITGLFEPGPPRWFALTVRPQREVSAERWLAVREVYAFHPVRGRRVVRRGKVFEASRCYLPGYVFARFPGWPLVHRVLDGPFVTGAVSRADGEWGVLDPRDLGAIHRMRAVDDEIEARRALRRLPRPFTPGQAARLRTGPLADHLAEVVEVPTTARLVLRLRLFSREMLVEVDAGDAIHA